MRYRAFNSAGLAVSAITLSLLDTPMPSSAAPMALVFAALEAGINSFELVGLSEPCLAAVRAAIDMAGRNALVVTLRLAGAAGPNVATLDGLVAQVAACRDRLGGGRLDALLIDPDGPAFPLESAQLSDLRGRGLSQMIGVACGPEGPDEDLASAGYDVVAIPFGLQTGAGLRKRLHVLAERNITLMGYGFDDLLSTESVQGGAVTGLARLFKRRSAPVDLGPYDFLYRTPDWSAEAIALAYALTDPSLATVRVQTTDIAKLDRLAKAVERGLPKGAAAQIEMARLSAPA